MAYKTVRFSPAPVKAVPGVTRPLTQTEAWSLYHFESHARQCRACFDPLDVHRRGEKLCHTGQGLGHDVSYHVYYRDGLIYSTHPEDGKLVHVEIPTTYGQLRSLLKAMNRGLTCTRASAPVLSYERNPSIRTPRYALHERATYIVEPAASTRKPRSSLDSKPRYYPTITTKDLGLDSKDLDDEINALPVQSLSLKDRRGTLYARDMQRKQASYMVEIREPPTERRRRASAIYA